MESFKDFVNLIISFINPLLVLIAGLALLVFLWGLAKFIFRVGGDKNAVEEGRNLMMWGIVGLFVMVSFIGIINFFYEDLEFDNTFPFGIPFLPEGDYGPTRSNAPQGGTGAGGPQGGTEGFYYGPTRPSPPSGWSDSLFGN